MKQYSITVKPGTSQTKITETDAGDLVVYLRAKPHDGEANTELIKLLAKHFDVPKTSIKVVRGAHSRHKVIEF